MSGQGKRCLLLSFVRWHKCVLFEDPQITAVYVPHVMSIWHMWKCCHDCKCLFGVLDEDRSGHLSTSNMFVTDSSEIIQAYRRLLLKPLQLACNLLHSRERERERARACMLSHRVQTTAQTTISLTEWPLFWPTSNVTSWRQWLFFMHCCW
jgi:hypothetical protein